MQGEQFATSWSPDGRTLAFNSMADGQNHLWTIDVEGANLRRITSEAGYHKPTWSRDGASLYVSKAGATRIVSTSKSNSTSRVNFSNIWRIPVAGGPAEQVTQSGGVKGIETADGKALVYQPGMDRSGEPILVTPLSRRSPRQLVPCAYGFSVGTRGVYYYPCRPEGPPVALGSQKPIEVRLIDPATGRDRAVATVPDLSYGDVFWGPQVSPDGSRVLYTRLVNRGEDLMMIDNFR
jgi:Tol biopolymer transport system component